MTSTSPEVLQAGLRQAIPALRPDSSAYDLLVRMVSDCCPHVVFPYAYHGPDTPSCAMTPRNGSVLKKLWSIPTSRSLRFLP